MSFCDYDLLTKVKDFVKCRTVAYVEYVVGTFMAS